jgi:thiosulfate reductase cytochrome b subunit
VQKLQMDRGPNYLAHPLPVLAHPLPVRIMHWIGAAAVTCMILSGWAIYNASPLLPFTFPRWMSLGGWLGGGIAWHLSAMWVLFADGLAYLGYGIVSGHFLVTFYLLGQNSYSVIWSMRFGSGSLTSSAITTACSACSTWE